MKTKPIQAKLKLLLLCVLSASALNFPALAQNKVVTTSTTETGTSYHDVPITGAAALRVYGSGVQYTGTNITLTATSDYGYGYSGFGAVANNQSQLVLTGGTITISGNEGYGVYLSSTSSGIMNNVSIVTTGYGARAADSSTLNISGGTITTSGNGNHGIGITNSSGTISDVTIKATGQTGRGIFVSSGTLTADQVTVITGSDNGLGVYNYGNSVVNASGLNIITSGSRSIGLLFDSSGTSTVNGGVINTSGQNAYGVYMGDPGNDTLLLTDVDIYTTGVDAAGIMLTARYSALKTVVVDGGSITSDLSAAIQTNEQSRTNLSLAILQTMSGTYDVTIKGGAQLSGQTATELNSIWTGTDSTGAPVSVDVPTALILKAEESVTISGDVNVAGSAELTLNLSDSSTLTGNVTAGGTAAIAITLDGAGTELHGNFIQEGGDSIIDLNLGTGTLLEGGGELDSLTLENGVTIGYTGTTITVTDSITIDGTVTIDLSNLTATGDYDILDWSAATGNVNVGNANYNFTGAGVEGDFEVKDGQLVFTATAVPEPSIWFLMGAGLGVLLLAARYRRQARTDA